MTVSIYRLCLAFLILLVAALAVGGLATTLQILFPLLAVTIGLYTLRYSPTRNYLQFTMLLWMFAPLVRRLSDWQGARTQLSLIILTPVLVSMLSFLALPGRWPRRQAGLLYTMIGYIVVVLWGSIIGFGSGQILPVIYAFLTWIAPVGLAMLIISRGDQAEEMGDTLVRAIVLGAAVMAIYGLIQYAIVPPWDKAWVLDSGMASVGVPAPYQIRVFSTLNSPGVLAIVLMSALLVIFNKPSILNALAGGVIALAFAVTLVRSSWGGLLLGLLLFLSIGRIRVKLRVAFAGSALLLVAIPALIQSSAFQSVNERMQTLTALDQDVSFNARAKLVDNMLDDIPALLLGHGIGASGLAGNLGEADSTVSIDNGLLDVLFQFGLPALALFAILGYWIVKLVRALRLGTSISTSAVISLSILALMLFGNILTTPNGNFLFPFLGVSLAATAATRQREAINGNGDRLFRISA